MEALLNVLVEIYDSVAQQHKLEGEPELYSSWAIASSVQGSFTIQVHFSMPVVRVPRPILV